MPLKPILLVEDEEALCSLIRQLLHRAGFQVIPARTEDEARTLLAARRSQFSIVMVDWELAGGGSGERLARHISRTHPGTRLILMHDLLPASRQLEACPAGWAFLEKPFLPGELCRIVRESTSSTSILASV
jgi:DNA-binding NtrC family response regulator